MFNHLYTMGYSILFDAIDLDFTKWHIITSRGRASDRHCCKMGRNNKFCAKNIHLATTIGKKKKKTLANFFFLALECHLWLKVIDWCRLMGVRVYLNCQLTPQLSITLFRSSSQTWTCATNHRLWSHLLNYYS